MSKVDFHIRQMEMEDLPAAMDIKKEEGWNQTLKDWEFLLNDPSGTCLVATHQNQVVATVSAIGYDNRLAWIGMMLVRKEHRGQGLAKILMRAIMERLQDYPAIKLDATPAGFPVYARLGFVSEYTIWRMTKPPLTQPSAPIGDLPVLVEESLQDIIAYDQKTYGVNRKQLLQYLHQQSPQSVRLAGGKKSIMGYIMGRPGTNYHQLGSLLADSTAIAIDLISPVLSQHREQPVVVDVLADQEEMITWLKAHGFTTQRELIRMYYQHNPFPGNLPQQFLISGPELG
jgi:GNAT superfamily N-acetyltransferase